METRSLDPREFNLLDQVLTWGDKIPFPAPEDIGWFDGDATGCFVASVWLCSRVRKSPEPRVRSLMRPSSLLSLNVYRSWQISSGIAVDRNMLVGLRRSLVRPWS